MGHGGDRAITRVAGLTAAVVFVTGVGALATLGDGPREATIVASGRPADVEPGNVESGEATDGADAPPGGGWEEHRSSTTRPGTARPEVPPGQTRRSTTTTHKPNPGDGPKKTTTTSLSSTTTSTMTPKVVHEPSDLVPPFSVLDEYPLPAYVGPLDPAHPNQRPWDAALVHHGATKGYARTWVKESGPGGYTVLAFEFPTESAAKAAGDDAFAMYLGDFSADSFAIRDGVSSALIVGDCARAYWTYGRYLRIVDISTQFGRDVNVEQAQADMRTIVEALIAL